MLSKIYFREVSDKIELYQEIQFHKQVGVRQRISYLNHIKDKELLKKNLVIEMDYKAQVPLGKFN